MIEECDLLESFLKVKAGSAQMKNSTKGMLLSGLIYPGLGQLILGHVFSGIIFVLLATIGHAYFAGKKSDRQSQPNR
jgi:hypothetical protein